MAWAAAITVAGGALPLISPLAMAVASGVASLLIVLASAAPILSIVPATFYGFASTFAYLSLAPGAFTINALTAVNWENAIVAMPVSLLIGTCLGIAQGRLSQVLVASETTAARNLRLDGSPALDSNGRPLRQ
jgi:hypothetical protein